MILDLHRMNKIIEVDEENAYAIVEPGVSFFDLYEYLKEKGYNLWLSCPALGWGSVLGNTLERGFGYTPGGEHSQQQCGMEVVLANGKSYGPVWVRWRIAPCGRCIRGVCHSCPVMFAFTDHSAADLDHPSMDFSINPTWA